MDESTSTRDPEGEDLLPLSALNDLLYCERRCWLHRVAGVDADNVHTLLGTFEHEKVDESDIENRPGLRIERALPVFSRTLGLIGRADVVEFRLQPDGSELPFPIDYKHGPRRKWVNDDAQLCAQALCIEEMLHIPVPAGAIFHQKTKRRREVPFTPALREQVRQAAVRLHQLLHSVEPPPASLKPQCEGCSLHAHCFPEAVQAADGIGRMMSTLFQVRGES